MKTLRRVLLEGRKKGTNRRGVGVHGVTKKDAKRARENVLAQNELRRRAEKARREREDSQDGRLSPETNASVYRAQAGADQKFMRMVGLSTQRVGPPSKRGDAARKLQLQRDTDAIRKRPAPHEISSSRVYPLTLPMISEKKLFHVNQQDGEEAVDDLVRTTGKADAKTPRSERRRAAQLDDAEKPKSRKPAKPGDTPKQTLVRQDMFDLARHRRKKAEAWDEEATGRPTPYPSTSKKPGTERGVPTTRRRRQAANMLRAATGKPLLKVDSITPLTLPMIAESNRERKAYTKAENQKILKKLHAQGDKRVDSSTPGKLKFKQREPEVGESGGFYSGQLKDKRDNEAARRAENTWDFSDSEQKRKGFEDRYYS